MTAGKASQAQIDGILIAAGRLLLKLRGVELFSLSRESANRLRLSLEYEYRTGVSVVEAPPPDTRKRRYGPS